MGQSKITAQQLQHAIAALGMVQEEFAAELGVRHATVSRWLSGRVPVQGYVEAWLREAHPKVYAEIIGGGVDDPEG